MDTKNLISAYIQMTKPRILLMVLLTTAMGYFLGSGGVWSWATATFLMLGTGAVCAGATVLNQYLERDADSKMLRTQNRPIPKGVVAANHAMLFGVALVLFGVFFVYWKINLLTAFLSLLTAFLYVLVYTPVKRMSWLNLFWSF